MTQPQADLTRRSVDGWERADLGDVSIDPVPVAEMLDHIDDGTYSNVHSVLLARHGRLALEKYFEGTYSLGVAAEEEQRVVAFDADMLHTQHSVTKSVTSLLIGIAIDHGFIESVDERLSRFYPQHADVFAESAKGDITLHHLLSMTAGLRWDESTHPYTDLRNDHVALALSSDKVRFTLELPLVDPPGKTFRYNSGISIMLGDILYQATGMRADRFAEDHLFGPLGITTYDWFSYPGGEVQTGGGLSLTPRDMAKVGQLALQRGQWRGQRIVSEEWIAESTRQQAPDFAYGYQWWLTEAGAAVKGYSAQGRGGQVIAVLPDLDLVATFTAWNDGTHPDQASAMLTRFIIPACQGGDSATGSE